MHKFTVHRNSKLPKEPNSIWMRRKKQWISYVAELQNSSSRIRFYEIKDHQEFTYNL